MEQACDPNQDIAFVLLKKKEGKGRLKEMEFLAHELLD